MELSIFCLIRLEYPKNMTAISTEPIAIIGVLATLVMANFAGVRSRARDAQRKADMKQIQLAFETYRADQGAYPTTLPTCGSSLSAGSTKTGSAI